MYRLSAGHVAKNEGDYGNEANPIPQNRRQESLSGFLALLSSVLCNAFPWQVLPGGPGQFQTLFTMAKICTKGDFMLCCASFPV